MSLRRDVRKLKKMVGLHCCEMQQADYNIAQLKSATEINSKRLCQMECTHDYRPAISARYDCKAKRNKFVSKCVICDIEKEITEMEYLEAMQSQVKANIKRVKEEETANKTGNK